MFSVVSVCHVTITHDALDFTIQGPPPKHGTSLYRDPLALPPDMGPNCTGTPLPSSSPTPPSLYGHPWPQCHLVTPGGQYWILV